VSDKEDPAPSSAQHITRRLATILHADVQGYSRLIQANEVATLRVLTPYLRMMNALVRQHGGHPIGSRGDSLLAEFPSVRSAVQCAVEMQRELRTRNTALLPEQRIAFRMGIHVGEIVEDGEQLHGDGINIAVRIEGLAEAGGICISDAVYNQVKNKLPLQYKDLGEQRLKNIADPVRVYQVVLEESESAQAQVQSLKSQSERQKPRRVGRSVFVPVFVSVLLIAGVIAVRYFPFPTPSTQHPTPSTQAAPAALPLPDKPSIVVLPFVNLSGDPGQEYFSDGITEELTASLSRLANLFVISRNSAFFYKGKAVKVQDLSRELGVKYVLEGSVRKAANQVRITAQLIDATTDHHLWSERYDRPLQDIFALQDEIAQKIVTTLKLQLPFWEQGIPVRRHHTDNVEAYDFYLRGLESLLRAMLEAKKEANGQARQLFERALALDSTYALAYAGLGGTYFNEWFFQWNLNRAQTLERALELLQRAVTLDDSLSMPHMLLGHIYLWNKQHDQAIAEIRRAIALDPNLSDNYLELGIILVSVGQPEEAIEAIKKGMRLNPRYTGPYPANLGL
jgi:adenylate cyclase